MGISDEKLSHVGDDPLPDGVFEPDEAVIVRYAQTSTRMDPITDELYGELTRYFDVEQIIELCMTVSLSNQVNRFHATFLTDLDEDMALAESWNKKGQAAEAAACLKKVMALCPNTRHADLAQAELVRLQGKTPAVPAGLTKP